MADSIGNRPARDYRLDVPPAQEGFCVKGAAHCGWGMQSRLARIFRPDSGNTVMLAFDREASRGQAPGLPPALPGGRAV